jgi:SEC-C motif
MGHAVHFLQRIERLSPAQADLALTLYREPELVAHVLGRVRLPDGAERVALALEDAPKSPHVIVTRDGRFVTCLGAGMSVSNLPVVSRPQIDHASEKIEALRATLAAGHSETRRLLRRLLQRGSGLSREDFTALTALMPIIGNEIVGMALDICDYLKRFHEEYHRHLYRKITPAVRDDLQRHWAAEWALGHLAAICGERVDDVQALCAERLFQITFNLLLAGTGLTKTTPIVMRGVWATARTGRALLGDTRDRLQKARTPVESLIAGMALTAIGMRHRRSQGEVTKALARYRRSFETTAKPDSPDELTQELMALLEKLLADPAQQERWREIHQEDGARAFVHYTEPLPEGTPLRCTRPEDVPDDLALPTFMHLFCELPLDSNSMALAQVMLPWLATASGPALYLPAQILDQCKSLFDAEDLARRLAKYHYTRAAAPPVRAPSRPGRNEPCPCGSGKKYKRCCGAEAPAA